MKRKQFHITVAEEQALYEISHKEGISEAEVVRRAIKEFARQYANATNSLLGMSNNPLMDGESLPEDLSESHDEYLAEILTHEQTE